MNYKLIMKRVLATLIFLSACHASHNSTAEVTPPQVCLDMPDFRCVFRWVMMDKCLRCHHASGFQAGFDASIYKEVMKTVVPCHAEDSDLYGIIKFKLMPPKDEPEVTREELAMVKLWINQGANESNEPIVPPTRRRRHRDPQPIPAPWRPECSPFNP